jgi:hypothetical protein
MVLEIASHHRPQPFHRVPDRPVQPLAQLGSQILQLGRHPFAHGLSMYRELPGLVVRPTDVGETQKVKGLRLPLPTLLPALRGITPELDQACLVRV